MMNSNTMTRKQFDAKYPHYTVHAVDDDGTASVIALIRTTPTRNITQAFLVTGFTDPGTAEQDGEELYWSRYNAYNDR